ncbi:hypothetical protein ZEAMMB73_Zm00001d051947 [Zea mays]|uniref:Uncharacterized protein n=1 Tax=Zea mays TaxID=4577 RepID=A0A1D6QB26_MAIZE|nr:hypothetical protein ZEAMMB73_Zm00001d051947 [Zea mays]
MSQAPHACNPLWIWMIARRSGGGGWCSARDARGNLSSTFTVKSIHACASLVLVSLTAALFLPVPTRRLSKAMRTLASPSARVAAMAMDDLAGTSSSSTTMAATASSDPSYGWQTMLYPKCNRKQAQPPRATALQSNDTARCSSSSPPGRPTSTMRGSPLSRAPPTPTTTTLTRLLQCCPAPGGRGQEAEGDGRRGRRLDRHREPRSAPLRDLGIVRESTGHSVHEVC